MQAWNAEMQPIAIAGAVCDPRRADARRSFLCVRYFPHDVRFSRHGFRFTEPRRADARRSCERSFVHRKWRFMQRTNVVHQERLA
jgi:hypothetical protein